MRILDKYTIKSFIPVFLYCVGAFIFMYMMVDLLGHLDEILRNKIKFITLFEYYRLLVPIIFVQIVPIATLLSVVWVFSNMNRHNEITAMKAAGLNVLEVAKPFLFVGITMSLAVMLVNEVFVPHATVVTTKIKQSQIEHIRGTPKKDALLSDVAIYGEDNRLYYVKEFDTVKRKLNEVIILEHDAANNVMSKIVAKSARWENGAWLFSNCIVYKLDKNGELTGRPQVYPKKTMAIRETPRDFYRGQFESQVMNYSQLSEYVKKFYKVDKKIARRLAVDLYYKTSFPFTSFVVVLLGIGFGLHTRRGGALWGLGTSVGISFVYYGIVAICLAAGKGGWLPPAMAAWLGNILFLGIGFVLLLRHSL